MYKIVEGVHVLKETEVRINQGKNSKSAVSTIYFDNHGIIRPKDEYRLVSYIMAKSPQCNASTAILFVIIQNFLLMTLSHFKMHVTTGVIAFFMI